MDLTGSETLSSFGSRHQFREFTLTHHPKISSCSNNIFLFFVYFTAFPFYTADGSGKQEQNPGASCPKVLIDSQGTLCRTQAADLPPIHLSLFLKFFLANAAQRANKVFRQVLKLGAGSDSVFRVTQVFFVNITANAANVFLHNSFSFSVTGFNDPNYIFRSRWWFICLWLYYNVFVATCASLLQHI